MLRSCHAFLGGTFDPPHAGHLAMAQVVAEHLQPDSLHFVPAHVPPHKVAVSAAGHRRAMLDLALQGSGWLIDDRELRRPLPSWTVDTLAELRQECGSAVPLVWVVGMDSLLALPTWKHWQQLTDLAHLLVISRPGFTLPGEGDLADWLKTRRRQRPELLKSSPAGGVCLLETLWQPVSSTALRAELACGAGCPAALPETVYDYIRREGLYASLSA